MSYTINDVIAALSNGLITKEQAVEYAKNVFDFRYKFEPIA